MYNNNNLLTELYAGTYIGTLLRYSPCCMSLRQMWAIELLITIPRSAVAVGGQRNTPTPTTLLVIKLLSQSHLRATVLTRKSHRKHRHHITDRRTLQPIMRIRRLD